MPGRARHRDGQSLESPLLPVVARRPFRAPHHTIGHAGLVGGGGRPSPGEISLAQRGVIFLDELPEFGQAGLEKPPQKNHWRTASAAG